MVALWSIIQNWSNCLSGPRTPQNMMNWSTTKKMKWLSPLVQKIKKSVTYLSSKKFNLKKKMKNLDLTPRPTAAVCLPATTGLPGAELGRDIFWDKINLLDLRIWSSWGWVLWSWQWWTFSVRKSISRICKHSVDGLLRYQNCGQLSANSVRGISNWWKLLNLLD